MNLRRDWFTFFNLFLDQSMTSVILVVFGGQAPFIAGKYLTRL